MKNTKSNDLKTFFEYKGKPLVRCKNTIYYGNITDKYVFKMESKNFKDVQGTKVATSVNVEMINTDDDSINSKKIVKISEKSGLYPALEIANIWLERAMAGQ
ncbi:MAG: hypothetical protein ACI4PR_05300 [Acutalibacteraceae bacterium]